MANYDITSPYYTTGYSQFFLDTMTNRPIPPLQDDLSFAINLPISTDPICWPMIFTVIQDCGGYSISAIPTP